MNVLAIDCASELMSVCLLHNDPPIRVVLRMDAGLTHGARLIPAIESVLSSAAVDLSEVNLVACTRGPGSFTGLRIAMATTKGLTAATDLPMAAVPSLEAIAHSARCWPGLIVAAIDARKKRFYAALFAAGARLTPDMDAAPATLALFIERHCGELPVLLTGPAANMLLPALQLHWSAAHQPAQPPVSQSAVSPAKGTTIPTCIVDAHARGSVAEAVAELVSADPARYRLSDDEGPVYVRDSDAEIGVTAPRPRSVPEWARTDAQRSPDVL
ncbi:MAG: tRNA (adenosine(37)-N6)-threonylcarbamoyltransferase complex dimerization subunit type 1 TsaB [Spirochaetaceae bacterium]|nr:MAG: tRNA (adenosine(37)-N6)-threonylcarbamoyltransferase complex dimerization subunit type 1 TsaB [Spirochaetaceae bacterium]